MKLKFLSQHILNVASSKHHIIYLYHSPHACSSFKTFHSLSLTFSTCNQAIVEFGDDVSLKFLRERVKKEKRRLCLNGKGGELEAEAEMEKLCRIKNKIERLQLVLLTLRDARYNKTESSTPNAPSFIYVPVAALKEKT